MEPPGLPKASSSNGDVAAYAAFTVKNTFVHIGMSSAESDAESAVSAPPALAGPLCQPALSSKSQVCRDGMAQVEEHSTRQLVPQLTADDSKRFVDEFWAKRGESIEASMDASIGASIDAALKRLEPRLNRHDSEDVNHAEQTPS